MTPKCLNMLTRLSWMIILAHVFTSSNHMIQAEPITRINCYPEAEIDQRDHEEKCLARNCLFDSSATSGVIQCYLPQNYGYQMNGNVTNLDNGIRISLKRNRNVMSPFPEPIEHVSLDVHYYTDDIIRIKLYDSDSKRYEVPIPLAKSKNTSTVSRQYIFSYVTDPIHDNLVSFQVKRQLDQAVIFDTSIGGLVLNDQYLQIVTRLQSPHVYGFGENNHDTLKHDVRESKSWGIFARDQGTNWATNANHYGSHPFYVVMEQVMNSNAVPSGRMHGVLLLNSNAMDYSFQSTPSVTLRTIGGILDIFIFLGPTPEQVVQQYTWLVGRPILPPYWSLGFQLSRWEYSNLTHMQYIVERNREAGVPLDVQYADIDHMEAAKDFTIDPKTYTGLGEYFQKLNEDGVRTIIILDPAILVQNSGYRPLQLGIDNDVFIKWGNGSFMRGSCWPGDVFFPDFFKQTTKDWWGNLIEDFYRNNVSFDGLWIDMNEPAVFDTNEEKPWNSDITGSNYTLKCPSNEWDDPPYRPKAVYRWDQKDQRTSRLSDRTLCMVAEQGEIDPDTGRAKYRHYDVHSLYGWSQTKPTLDIMQNITGKRSLVLPRSTFVGSGQWSGHWLGDNEATWHEMKRSLIGMIEFNWFGIPLNGADICGFDKTPSEEMCIRWMQVGAFYPYARNHNVWKTPDQDPAAWSSYALKIMIEALHIRYKILPYYYTLFYKANTLGSTVIRPLFHEFPTDKITLDIYLQFLIGPSIMIAPVTDDGARHVDAYLPSAFWYDYYTGTRFLYQQQFTRLSAPLHTIPILLRGGSIIPIQDYANNTRDSRKNFFGLIIVLQSVGDAEGDLFYDDGESIDTVGKNLYYYAKFKWSSSEKQLSMTIENNNYPSISALSMNSLSIYGLTTLPKEFIVDGRVFTPHIKPGSSIVEVIGLKLNMSTSWSITWSENIPLNVTIVSLPDLEPKYRVDCHPDNGMNRDRCIQRGCLWSNESVDEVPTCYIPKPEAGYQLHEILGPTLDTSHQYTLLRRSDSRGRTGSARVSLFSHDIESLKVQVSNSGTDILRLTIRDNDAERYEPPVPIHWYPTESVSSVMTKINFELTQTVFGQIGFRIRRTDTQTIIFDTSFFAEGFVYEDKFIQFITTIPSRNIYGFGENTHPTFRHVLRKAPRYGMFARDQPPYGSNENLYGTHPFYMVIEENGASFGVFIFNSNAQDYRFDEYEKNQATLTYRTIGGILDIFFFAGPRPEDVIRQYQKIIHTPYMPPYWALGFQLCRYGYNTLENMKAAMQRTLDAQIPLDVMYGDIDYFYKRLDFTWDPERFADLPKYVEDLHRKGMKFITILDPAIDSEQKNYDTFSIGEQNGIWVKWPVNKNLQFNETNNRNMLGYVWPDGKAVFPDYFYPPAKKWWYDQIVDYHQKLKFDGIWIDMNEPANFDTNFEKPWNWNRSEIWNLHCPLEEVLENPPYKTAINGAYLSDKTLCMIGEQIDSHGKTYKQYDVHNLYGWSETIATLPAARALDNKRSIVISRSTFPTSGAYSGHWLGDNTAAWSHVKYNIIGMLEFNLFGIPYIGADICGFERNTTAELCQRWMQLGAFNPFFRNHNGIRYADQDPANFPEDVVHSNRHAVQLRYTLNPFLYTLFHRAHVAGGTVVRSMAHEFPTDPSCWGLDEQFLWGSHLLIAPVIYQGHLHKVVYLPPLERWYDYYSGREIKTLGTLNVTAPRDFIPLYLRGGSIIPHQASAMNTYLSRRTNFHLLVNLDKHGHAEGDLFWDDGESIDTYEKSNYNYFSFTFSKNKLLIEPFTYHYIEMGEDVKFNRISIHGLLRTPIHIFMDGVTLSSTRWSFDDYNNVLHLNDIALDTSRIHKLIFQ